MYFGSAKGKGSTSLNNRLARHFKKQKKVFWHIDHLTTNETVDVLFSFYNISPEISECSALQTFIKISDVKANVIKHFGSSDCKMGCGGHLLMVPGNKGSTIDYLINLFKKRLVDWRIYDPNNAAKIC